jgi:predicted phosphodiesterase
MERNKPIKIPDAILCGDFHLREDQPTCRTDNFEEKQWEKVDYIKRLQVKYNIPYILHSGDLFHHWKASPYLLSKTIEHLPKNFYTVTGNHDLPQHSMDLLNKSGINTLQVAGAIKILDGCHFGQVPEKGFTSIVIKNRKILVWHILTYQGTKPFPNSTYPMAARLLRKYSDYDLILCGDNHLSFVEEFEGRLLINPGSLTRQTAAQADHQPCIYLWYAEDNSWDKNIFPIDHNVISREHLKVKEERDGRIDAFVSRLNEDYKTEMSFEQNLENFFQVNTIRESVKSIIYHSLE